MSTKNQKLTVAEVLHQQVLAEKELSRDLEHYAGEWVAVRDHKVIAHAPSLEDLAAQVDDLESVDAVFEVPEGEYAACFF